MEVNDIPFHSLKISHRERRIDYWNTDTFRENLGRYLQADRSDGTRFREMINGWVTVIVHGDIQLTQRTDIGRILDDSISVYLKLDAGSARQLNLNRDEAYTAMLGVWIALFPDKELS